MSLLENRLENWAVRKAEENYGWIGIKLNNAAANGYPDRMFIKEKDVFFVEFKREGEVPRRLQNYRIRKLVELNHRVYVVDNKKEMHNVFQHEFLNCMGSTPISRVGNRKNSFQRSGRITT